MVKNQNAAAAKSLQLCPTLCDPRDGSPPGSPVPRILQARILEWIAIPFSRGSSQPRNQTQISCIASKFFNVWAIREAPDPLGSYLKLVKKSENEVAQSCPTPSDPMDCSLPGSSVHGIYQARELEWGAIAFSKKTRIGYPKKNFSFLKVSSAGVAS